MLFSTRMFLAFVILWAIIVNALIPSIRTEFVELAWVVGVCGGCRPRILTSV